MATVMVTFLPGNNTEYELPVKYIAYGGFPHGPNGSCAFCNGDPCAEAEGAENTPIGAVMSDAGDWTDACPFCRGRAA